MLPPYSTLKMEAVDQHQHCILIFLNMLFDLQCVLVLWHSRLRFGYFYKELTGIVTADFCLVHGSVVICCKNFNEILHTFLFAGL